MGTTFKYTEVDEATIGVGRTLKPKSGDKNYSRAMLRFTSITSVCRTDVILVKRRSAPLLAFSPTPTVVGVWKVWSS